MKGPTQGSLSEEIRVSAETLDKETEAPNRPDAYSIRSIPKRSHT